MEFNFKSYGIKSLKSKLTSGRRLKTRQILFSDTVTGHSQMSRADPFMSVWVFLLACVGQAMSVHQENRRYHRCVSETILPAGLGDVSEQRLS